MQFTSQELARCARRELAQRLQVYPGMVARGTMPQAEADRQIAMMRQIAVEYEEVAYMESGAQLELLEGESHA